MNADKARWMFQRLAQMPPPEWRHRLHESRRRKQDADGSFAARVLADADDTPLVGLSLPEDALRSIDRGDLARDVDALLADDGLELLGLTRPASARRDFTLEPEGGGHWPQDAFCYQIDFTHAQAGRDIKLTWELMRLHHCQVLALGAVLLDRDDARQACWGDIAAFLEQCPPYLGVAWAGGIETAARLTSLLVVLGLLGEPPEALRVALQRSLRAHQAWCYRYPSLYSSANNHLIAELAGAWLAACALGEHPLAPRRDALAALLVREANRQVLPDGVGVEQSPTYQAYTLEWLLLCRQVGLSTGHPLPSALDVPLRAGGRFLAALHDEGGHHPRFGDDDEGVVLRFSLAHEAHYVASVCNAIAGALHEPAARVERAPDLRCALLGACDLPDPPTRGSERFGDGGYTLLVEGPTRVLFDHGPLGYTIGAHGHADTLSVWVHHRGAPLVIDPGTYRYNGADAWRDWFRGTASHPTLTVDGRSSSRITGRFHWGSRARVVDGGFDLAQGRVWAEHDGYPQHHRRHVSLSPGLLVVEDALDSPGSVQLTWPLAPDLEVRLEADGAQLFREGARVATLRVEGPVQRALHQQNEAPAPGVCSPRYNQLTASPVLVFTGALPAGTVLRTVIELP